MAELADEWTLPPVLREDPMDMNTFQVTTYRPDLAGSLADMWNRSGNNWGGSAVLHTRETILAEHAASINLAEFLAVDAAGEVIGFCTESSNSYLGWWKRLCVTARNGETALTDPVFLLSGTRAVPNEELADLLRLRFTRQPD